MISKDKVRRKALETRNNLEKGWRHECSGKIVEQVTDNDVYRQAEIVLSYSAIFSEVETQAMNQRILDDGKKLYLPKVYAKDKAMKFYLVETMDKLKKGYQGIREPVEENPLETVLESQQYSKNQILMIMPGVTYDGSGNRMGYGGGYYDRYLHLYGEYITTVLIAFNEQKSLIIPAERCDVKPDYIMTQTGICQND